MHSVKPRSAFFFQGGRLHFFTGDLPSSEITSPTISWEGPKRANILLMESSPPRGGASSASASSPPALAPAFVVSSAAAQLSLAALIAHARGLRDANAAAAAELESLTPLPTLKYAVVPEITSSSMAFRLVEVAIERTGAVLLAAWSRPPTPALIPLPSFWGPPNYVSTTFDALKALNVCTFDAMEALVPVVEETEKGQQTLTKYIRNLEVIREHLAELRRQFLLPGNHREELERRLAQASELLKGTGHIPFSFQEPLVRLSAAPTFASDRPP